MVSASGFDSSSGDSTADTSIPCRLCALTSYLCQCLILQFSPSTFTIFIFLDASYERKSDTKLWYGQS